MKFVFALLVLAVTGCHGKKHSDYDDLARCGCNLSDGTPVQWNGRCSDEEVLKHCRPRPVEVPAPEPEPEPLPPEPPHVETIELNGIGTVQVWEDDVRHVVCYFYMRTFQCVTTRG